MNEVEPAIPTYYVRYEDLILNCQETLEQLFCFLLEVESIAGTVIEKRIRDASSKGQGSTVYQLKANPADNLSRNRFMYTDEQYERMKETMREFNYYYGYADHPEGDHLSDPNTTFHKYTKDAQHQMHKVQDFFMGFKHCNE